MLAASQQGSLGGDLMEVCQTGMGWKDFELIIIVKKLDFQVFFFPDCINSEELLVTYCRSGNIVSVARIS